MNFEKKSYYKNYIQSLVVDIGSSMIKVGFGGDDAPRFFFCL
jgi:actin-related protein